ncbi:hypothetical protein NPIL_656591 [Nephila pilipes]|uniref:Uncharacterized protein n=1 Tax=Nephila pilipes TaxID=299642 RepID=A0A8X6QW87_NEPPI|nr:hypothetical protein NPIL_656591 [Nephila pilipes]
MDLRRPSGGTQNAMKTLPKYIAQLGESSGGTVSASIAFGTGGRGMAGVSLAITERPFSEAPGKGFYLRCKRRVTVRIFTEKLRSLATGALVLHRALKGGGGFRTRRRLKTTKAEGDSANLDLGEKLSVSDGLAKRFEFAPVRLSCDREPYLISPSLVSDFSYPLVEFPSSGRSSFTCFGSLPEAIMV